MGGVPFGAAFSLYANLLVTPKDNDKMREGSSLLKKSSSSSAWNPIECQPSSNRFIFSELGSQYSLLLMPASSAISSPIIAVRISMVFVGALASYLRVPYW